MYRALIVLAALLGFGVAFAVTFVIGVEATASPECDGLCFDKWDEVLWVSGGVGVAAAIVSGLFARYALRRYFEKPS